GADSVRARSVRLSSPYHATLPGNRESVQPLFGRSLSAAGFATPRFPRRTSFSRPQNDVAKPRNPARNKDGRDAVRTPRAPSPGESPAGASKAPSSSHEPSQGVTRSEMRISLTRRPNATAGLMET